MFLAAVELPLDGIESMSL